MDPITSALAFLFFGFIAVVLLVIGIKKRNARAEVMGSIIDSCQSVKIGRAHV